MHLFSDVNWFISSENKSRQIILNSLQSQYQLTSISRVYLKEFRNVVIFHYFAFYSKRVTFWFKIPFRYFQRSKSKSCHSTHRRRESEKEERAWEGTRMEVCLFLITIPILHLSHLKRATNDFAELERSFLITFLLQFSFAKCSFNVRFVHLSRSLSETILILFSSVVNRSSYATLCLLN